MGNWNHYRLFLHSQHSFISQREIFGDFLSKDFWFFANWVRHKVYPPAWERGGWQSESLRVFNTRQESGNGTQELRTGSRSVIQYGTRIRDWVPLSGDSFPEMGGVCDCPVCS